MLSFSIDRNAPANPLLRYWEKCVGSCHAYTALREDYRSQLRKARHDAGFQYVRFHGLLDDDMSVIVRTREGELRTCFLNVDCVFDFLLSIGMKPFIELGFMPEALAAGDTTCFHYKGNITKPKDYAEWDELIRALTQHLVDRYGTAEVRSWFFEVWNEPNLSFFYVGTQEDYLELYEHTAKAVKSVDSGLQVGGPATAINAWIPELISYCETNNVPLDFVSTHHYPTDDPLWQTDISLKDYFEKFGEAGWDKLKEAQNHYSRGILSKMAKQAKAEAGKYPLYYTEWNSSARVPDPLHDLPYSAALIGKTIIDNQDMMEAYSFWTFTDIFEENAQLPGEFHGGFGMQTVHGIPKPVYHTFEFLHQLGGERLPVVPEQGTVGMLATREGTELRIFAYNHNITDGEIQEEDITLTIQGEPFHGAEITLVDDQHGNPIQEWERLGSPLYPSRTEMDALFAASQVKPSSVPVESKNGVSEIRFTLRPHAVSLIRLF